MDRVGHERRSLTRGLAGCWLPGTVFSNPVVATVGTSATPGVLNDYQSYGRGVRQVCSIVDLLGNSITNVGDRLNGLFC